MRLAIAIGVGIAVLPARAFSKLGLALSIVGISQALRYLFRPHTSGGGAGGAPPGDGSTEGQSRTEAPLDAASLSSPTTEEEVYPRIFVDRHRNALEDDTHYRINGRLAMKAKWWSVTIVDEDFDPIPHEAVWHSFTSLNVVPTADGRNFVIDIAPERPPGASNWLPCRRGEPFNLVWRLYTPGNQIVDPKSLELPKMISVAS